MADKPASGAPVRPVQEASSVGGSTGQPVTSAEASWASTPAIRRTMQGNRGRDTQPELAVRGLLHAAGLRYRVNYRPSSMRRRTIDIAFTRLQVACFIDGCFWHGCPEHYVAPRSNADFWTAKIEGNRRRDAETDELLRSTGWSVLRFWEHEQPKEVVRRVRRALSPSGVEALNLNPPS